VGNNFGNLTTRSVQNYTNYYAKIMSLKLAETGANIAVNKIYITAQWVAGYSNMSYSPGTIKVIVTATSDSINKTVTSTGSYPGYDSTFTSTVTVQLRLSSFSKFGYYSVTENGIWWATGDTVNGPFHTQDYINSNGHPVFNPAPSYVSTKMGFNNASNSSPYIYGTYVIGEDFAIPSTGISTLESKAQSGGHVFLNHDTVYLNLTGDSLKYRYTWNGKDTTVKDTAFAKNKTIVADNATLRIKGTLSGQLTVGVSGSTKGDIMIDSSITYKTDPNVNPLSTDLLGIAAYNNVLVTDNSTNNSGSGIKIQGAIYAEKGGFGAQNYDKRKAAGYIYLTGGIAQYGRQAVGIIGTGGTISNGFNKSYHYDTRLRNSIPPNYPSATTYIVLSWKE
jgi:hypothetical protein